MRPIGRSRHVTPADWALLWKAALWLGAARVGLWLLPLRVVRRLLAHAAQRPAPESGSKPSRERVVWALSVAQRVVPGATCLPTALAAEALFARIGQPAELRVGVAKTPAGRLIAHAWVESGGRVLVGDLRDLSRYAPLSPLPRMHP
jgi:transglutaminase superfamily protein